MGCMMFLRRPAPVKLTAENALRLRTSLNSPVVASSELPSGPARAGILVHREADETLAVSVGVRSLKTADRAVWTCEADLGQMSELHAAVEAAISFAEGMGFLFDDVEVGAGAGCASGWSELMGHASAEPGRPDVPEGPVPVLETGEDDDLDFDPADLDLDVLGDGGPGDFDLDGDGDLFEDSAPEMPLSKFRGQLPADVADPGPLDTTGAGTASAPDPERRVNRDRRKPKAAKARSGAVPGRRSGRALPPLKDPGEAPEGRASLGKVHLVKRRPTLDAVRRTWLHRVLSMF